MHDQIPLIHMDYSEIEAIWFPGEDAGGWATNPKFAQPFRCDKIVAYGENGQLAPVPFYAVYREGQIISRVPAHLVEVRYKEARSHA